MDHLGVEVETTEAVHAATTRLAEAGPAADVENDTTCCYALQDKVWVQGPGQEPWEVYVVKADADTLAKQERSTCCTGSTKADPQQPAVRGGCCLTAATQPPRQRGRDRNRNRSRPRTALPPLCAAAGHQDSGVPTSGSSAVASSTTSTTLSTEQGTCCGRVPAPCGLGARCV